MGKKLYIGNLPSETTDADLMELFSPLGACESVALITDRETGRPRGFAFVEMGSASEAQAAIARLNGTELQGRSLTVSEARERSVASGRPRGFSRGH